MLDVNSVQNERNLALEHMLYSQVNLLNPIGCGLTNISDATWHRSNDG